MVGNVINIDNESYKALVESVVNHAILMIDVYGNILNWNKGAEKITGYKQEEIINKNFSIFYPAVEVDNGEHLRHLKKAKELTRYENEGWRVRKDGSVFQAHVTINALHDDNGSLVGFGYVIYDRNIGKSEATEGEIQRLNKELEFLLKQSQTEITDYKHALDESSIVAITDQKGIIKHVNENFCKISKYSKEELIGQDHRIINSGHHAKSFIRTLWVTITNGKIWRGELKNRAKDNTFYWVDTTIVPFLDQKGKPYQYLAIRSDISQRKLAEEQLYRINVELENKVKERTFELTEALQREKELSDVKSRFVSMASHEFRTPLSAILSSTALLEHYKTPEFAEKRIKHIERIKSSVKNLTGILDDFLSLEKLEEGKLQANNTDFDLREFINDVIEEMEGMLKKKQQSINYMHLGENKVTQDKKILRNILLNLLSNAVKYSHEEEEILLNAEVKNDCLVISVSDTGIGIPKDAQGELFSKFHRANNAIHIQGTGLGLHIVKRYVELMDGKITFTSKENVGTTFTLNIPRNT